MTVNINPDEPIVGTEKDRGAIVTPEFGWQCPVNGPFRHPQSGPAGDQ